MTFLEYQNMEIDKLFLKLSKSKFRSRFHLTKKDKDYINSKGIDVIKSHAYDFITKRLLPCNLANDGKQTPMRGHPVFIAQHATATCCRDCLYKWHHILKDQDLTQEQVDYIVLVIMRWIEKEVKL